LNINRHFLTHSMPMRTADADDDGTRALATRLDKHTTACAHSTSTTTTCAIVDGTRACEYERIVTRACPGQAPEIISRVTRATDGDGGAFDDGGAFGDATRALGAMREAFARTDATRGVFEAFAREAARAIASTTTLDDAGSGLSERDVARQGARGNGCFDGPRATTTTTTTGVMGDDDAGAAFGAREAFAALGAAARFVAAAADAAADMRAVESMATTSAAEEEDETKRIEP
jgi:hypothetical protein